MKHKLVTIFSVYMNKNPNNNQNKDNDIVTYEFSFKKLNIPCAYRSHLILCVMRLSKNRLTGSDDNTQDGWIRWWSHVWKWQKHTSLLNLFLITCVVVCFHTLLGIERKSTRTFFFTQPKIPQYFGKHPNYHFF